MPRCLNCREKFTPKRFLQKYCNKPECEEAEKKNFVPKPLSQKQHLKRGTNLIKKLSKKRQAENKIYLTIREKFLQENPQCAVYPSEKATQVHHKKGRIGKLLTDVRYFLPVSDRAHREIELNPEWAKKMGYSLSRLSRG